MKNSEARMRRSLKQTAESEQIKREIRIFWTKKNKQQKILVLYVHALEVSPLQLII